jgi:hypothetical protein
MARKNTRRKGKAKLLLLLRSVQHHPDLYNNMNYSLRPIILFVNIDVSRHILMVDTSVFVKSNMGRREYLVFFLLKRSVHYFNQFVVHLSTIKTVSRGLD